MKKRDVEWELEWMSVRDAATLIVGHLYKDGSKRGATDLVRKRIDRAAKVPRFSVATISGRRYVRSREFLIWAGHSWPELSSKVKLPTRDQRIVPDTGSIGISGNAPDIYQTPADIEQLRVMYAAERRKRLARDEALLGKQRELTEVERKNAELDAKFKKKRKDGGDGGRKGGRGREL